MARPKKEINENELGVICRLYASLKDCADYFNCSPDTIDRRVKEWGYEGFADFRDQNMVQTRLQLKRDLLERSKKSDVALIFALKNFCGFVDKVEQKTEAVDTINIQIIKDENQATS